MAGQEITLGRLVMGFGALAILGLVGYGELRQRVSTVESDEAATQTKIGAIEDQFTAKTSSIDEKFTAKSDETRALLDAAVTRARDNRENHGNRISKLEEMISGGGKELDATEARLARRDKTLANILQRLNEAEKNIYTMQGAQQRER